jgi:hypothetical protein
VLGTQAAFRTKAQQNLAFSENGNILRRHGLSPAPKRKQTVSWKDFICSHWDVLVGMDFFTAEALTLLLPMSTFPQKRRVSG